MQSNYNKQKQHTQRYRDARLALGWKQLYRFVPGDLAAAIDELIYQHRKNHYELWMAPLKRKLGGNNLTK